MAVNALEWTPDAVLDAGQMDVLRSLVGQPFFEMFSTHLNYYERELQQRPPVVHHYTEYCTLLKNTAVTTGCSQEKKQMTGIVFKLNCRTWAVFRRAFHFFKEDEELWSILIDFSKQFNFTKLFNNLVDGAVYFYGHKLDKLFHYWMFHFRDKKFYKKFDFHILSETRYMYDLGLWVHKDSEVLLIEAFKLELRVTFKYLRGTLYPGYYDDMNTDMMDLSRINNLFQVAEGNFHRHSNIFYQMLELTSRYKFASNLKKTILQFMMSTPNKDPNHWDALAKNELINDAYSKCLRLRNCIGKYKEGIIVVQTNEMWNKFIEFVFDQSLRLNIEPENLESDGYLIAKRILLNNCIWYINKKKKYEPSHYIRLINQCDSDTAYKIMQCALKRYPANTDILKEILFKLLEINKPLAFKLFITNVNTFSNTMWLHMVDGLSNEPYLNDILKLVFEDDSIYSEEVRSSLASKYLDWVSIYKSLDAARYAYHELIKNSNCNKKLYEGIINIEMKQHRIDLTKIRQHFILACMQFGDIDNDLWTMRANFELKYGTKKTYFFVCYWASTILKEDNVKFSNVLLENNVLL